MRKSITPKLLALAAVLLTAFYIKAPESQQMYITSSAEDQLINSQFEKTDNSIKPAAHSHSLMSQANTVSEQNLVTTIGPVSYSTVVNSAQNGNESPTNNDANIGINVPGLNEDVTTNFTASVNGYPLNVNSNLVNGMSVTSNNQAISMTCPQNITANATSSIGGIVNYSLPVVSGQCQQCTAPTSLPGFTYLGEFGGHRYFRSNFTRTWPVARDSALGLGAHLVTITSAAENNFLSGSEAWIGLTDEAVEGTFAWVTGEPVTYTNWWPSQPNNGGAGGNEDFVFMNFYGTNQWVDYGANYFYPFIIEFDCVETPVPTQTAGLPSGSVFPIGVTTNSFTYTDACNNTATCSFTVTVVHNQPTGITCPQNISVNTTSTTGTTVNYTSPAVIENCPQCTGPATLPGFNYIGELNGHRYFRSTSTSFWRPARDMALSLGAHLATITSAAENTFLNASGTDAWIGLTDEAVEGTFKWVTGEPFVYSNWYPGNPNNTGGNENHVIMNFFGSGQWVDHNELTSLEYIIEFECTATPMPLQTAGLPSGSVFPIGTTTNSFSYTDACANTVTCSFTVTVVNVPAPPVITCPQNITINTTSTSGSVVNYNSPVVTGGCLQCNGPTSLPGYTYLGDLGGHKYFRSDLSKTWAQAKAIAIGLGAHLVTINSAAENTLLSSNPNPPNTIHSWIGLTDEAVEGTFVWVTGEPVTYTNWYSGNPNNGGPGGNEDYGSTNFFGGDQWVDSDGSSAFPFIIEFECSSQAPTQTAGQASGTVFPVGVTTNSFSYTDACNVTVTCSFTVTVVLNQTTYLTCPQNITANASSSAGVVVNYNLPTVTSSCPQCVNPTSVPGFSYLGELNGHRYFRSNTSRKWPDARDVAISLGAHLVTISSVAENNLLGGGEAWIGLTDDAVEGTFVWVTGEPVTYTNWWPSQPDNGGAGGNEDYVFINFFGTKQWVDYGSGNANVFYPFIIEFECTSTPPVPTLTAGLPSGSVFPIGVTTNSFTYTDGCNTTVTCSFTVTVVNNQNTNIVCPQNISVNATSGAGATVSYTAPVVTENCPQCAGPATLPGFTYLGELNGHRYFRSTSTSFWRPARDMALSLGAHLATITSETENTFLNASGEDAWIGLTDEAVEGTFVWVTGEPLTYTNWFPGNPNNTGGNENHVIMNFFNSGKWADHNELTAYEYIIEFECATAPTPIQTAGLPSGSVFPIGVTTNSFSYTDACANTVTCSFTVTVVNNLPTTLTLTCPQNIVVNATSGSGAAVNYNLPVVNSNCQQCSLPSSIPGYTFLGELGGHKYFRSNFSRTWAQGKAEAIAKGAHLVTITSQAENNLLSAAGEAWIGFTDEAVEGTFVWVTGEPVTYTNWWPSNPNNGGVGGNEDYVCTNFYGTNQWVDHGTDYFYPFIIELECSSTLTPTQTAGLSSGSVFPVGVTTNSFTVTDGCNNTSTCSFTVTVNNNPQNTTIACPQNITVTATSGSGATVNYNLPAVTTTCPVCFNSTSLPGYTYLGALNGHKYFRSNFSRTWSQGKAEAIAKGAHLATINSQAENNLLSSAGEAWIGLTDEAVEGTFAWVTGEPVTYTNWFPGNPNNGGGDEDYVFMNFYSTNQWVDHGTFYFYPFIIEFECSTTPTQTAGLPSGSVFPVGNTVNSFSYTDACNNTVTCSFSVTVNAQSIRINGTDNIDKPQVETLINRAVSAKEMEVRAYPNPSAGDFNLQVFNGSDEPITVRILDLTGMVKKVFNLNGNTKTLKTGADLAQGIYVAEVIQGDKKQMVKLVKLY